MPPETSKLVECASESYSSMESTSSPSDDVDHGDKLVPVGFDVCVDQCRSDQSAK